jgi:hypothetical protein
MRTSNSLYTLLQVLPTADPAVIEAAYKALMKKHHPDLHGGEDAERRAAEINHAFNVLRDPERREAYDASERAREERYKVELARAFPDHPSGNGAADGARRNPPAPPAHFEAVPRPGQRAAGWIGAAGFLALVATIFLLARGDIEPPATAQSGAVATAAELERPAADPAAAPVPFRDDPVSGPQVANAVAEFNRISGTQGLPAAAAFSERCFETQSRTMSIPEFDYCVAFDHAAGRAEFKPAGTEEALAARRFQPQNQVARHVRAADPLADSFASIEIRLYEIRRLADAALAVPQPIAPIGAAMPALSRAAPAARVRSDAAPAQAPRPRRAPQNGRRQPGGEQDFLEREGGIY